MLDATYFGGTTGDRLDFGYFNEWRPLGAWTIYVRIYPLTPTGTLVSTWQGGPDRGYLWDNGGTGLAFSILGVDNTGYGATGPKWRVGQWQSAAAIFTGSGGIVDSLIDGVSLQKTNVGATTIKPTSLGAKIGNRGDLAEPFKGWMRDMALWDAVLTVAELKALEAGASPLSIRRDAISGYWPLTKDINPLVIGTAAPIKTGIVRQTEGEPTGLPFIFGGEGASVPPTDVTTVRLTLTPSALDIGAITEAGTVYLDLQPVPSDAVGRTEAATAYVDIQVLGGECYSRFHFTGEGEADTRWAVTDAETRWFTIPDPRWQMQISIQPGCH